MNRWRRTATALVTAIGLVAAFAPPATAAPVELKQNNSDAVTSGFACAEHTTTALRRYDLDGDHGITLPFTVTSASFGAWIVGFADAHTSTATVTISTIPDDDNTLAFGDLTPIGTADVELSSTNVNQFVLKSTDIEATVVDPTATDLVLAVTFVRDGGGIESGPGTNTDGESKPTYVASCDANPTISLLTDNIPGVYVPMWVTGEEATDTDSDGVADDTDNCVDTPNTDQDNHDDDALGDACDDDDDGDTVLDEVDACDILPGNPARPKAEGCPSVARTLTAHFANGDIAGSVESAAPQCVANVPVVVSWRKNDGTMKRRTTATNASGDFSVHSGPVKPDGAHHWFFWVRAPAVLIEDVGQCSFTTLRDPDTRTN